MHSTDWMLGAIKKITSAPQPRYNFNATVTKPICVFNLSFELHYPITHYHTDKKKNTSDAMDGCVSAPLSKASLKCEWHLSGAISMPHMSWQ